MKIVILSAVDPIGPAQGDRHRLNGLIRGVVKRGLEPVVVVAGKHPWLRRDMGTLLTRSSQSLYMKQAQWVWEGPAVDGALVFQLVMAPVSLQISTLWRVLDLTDSLSLYRRNSPWSLDTWIKKMTLWGIERDEATWTRGYDEVWVSAKPDADWLSRLKIRSTVVENGVVKKQRLASGDPRHLLLVGNFRYLPNHQGLQYFLRLWPSLAQKGFELTVIGEGSQGLVGERLKGYGRVPDVLPFYQRAGIAVSPVQWGTGSPNKVLEALGFGRPVVAESGGIQGLSLSQRQAVLGVSTREQWIMALGELQQSATYQERAAAGYSSVSEWGDAVAAQLEGLVRH